jgi:hypothetical protein
MLCVPPTASRRAIATAVATLAGQSCEPYALDVLLAEASPSGAIGEGAARVDSSWIQ